MSLQVKGYKVHFIDTENENTLFHYNSFKNASNQEIEVCWNHSFRKSFQTSFKFWYTRGEKYLPVCLQNTYFSANCILTEIFDLYQSAND